MRAGSRRTARSSDDAALRLVRDHAAELLRFARRFSICDDDAHDAYQRAVEILVRRMRTDPPEQPLKWLRSVIRNEAARVRVERRQLVGHVAVDLDLHEDRELDDPSDRAIGFERLRQLAEALQRLKPQELTALLLRAEGLSYKEIGTRNAWSYTKTNRCITEGRRALAQRLGAIESGAECERWLPLLSLLADGEATAAQLTELRPHLRACAGCRATLRAFHDAPRQVAALVPPALALATAAHQAAPLARHTQTLLHALLERTTDAAARAQSACDPVLGRTAAGAARAQDVYHSAIGRAAVGVARVQSALDAVSGAKLAAVAASGAALAGGGLALSQATHAASHRPPAVSRVAAAPAGPAGPARMPVGASSPSAAATAAGEFGQPSRAEWATPSRGLGSAAALAGEFAFEASSATDLQPSSGARSARGASSSASAPSAGSPSAFTASRTTAPADATVAPRRTASGSSPATASPAEFAGP
jgi:RNA polymerase sigma factor (sigma-70 family)